MDASLLMQAGRAETELPTAPPALTLEKVFRNHKHVVGKSWRMEKTYLKVKGAWKYPCLGGQGTQDRGFLLTAKRDASAARRFFAKAMEHNEVPDTVTMDKSR